MKTMMTVLFAATLLASAGLASTDAQERFHAKTGRYPAVTATAASHECTHGCCRRDHAPAVTATTWIDGLQQAKSGRAPARSFEMNDTSVQATASSVTKKAACCD